MCYSRIAKSHQQVGEALPNANYVCQGDDVHALHVVIYVFDEQIGDDGEEDESRQEAKVFISA